MWFCTDQLISLQQAFPSIIHDPANKSNSSRSPPESEGNQRASFPSFQFSQLPPVQFSPLLSSYLCNLPGIPPIILSIVQRSSIFNHRSISSFVKTILPNAPIPPTPQSLTLLKRPIRSQLVKPRTHHLRIPRVPRALDPRAIRSTSQSSKQTLHSERDCIKTDFGFLGSGMSRMLPDPINLQPPTPTYLLSKYSQSIDRRLRTTVAFKSPKLDRKRSV